jgi:hypothetical protein
MMRSWCNSYYKWALSTVDVEPKISTTKEGPISEARPLHPLLIMFVSLLLGFK